MGGIFDNSALGDHDTVVHHVRREGVALQFACRGCTTPKELTIEWPEVISLKYGIDPSIAFRNQPNVIGNPTKYTFHAEDGGWIPDLDCPGCGFRYAIVVGPDEPERWLATARRSGVLSHQMEQQLSQYVAGVANAARAQMQQARQLQRIR